MSTDNQNMQGDSEEVREASLCDDTIDEEGFASSRLVVGSVDSEGGGLPRQESLTPATTLEEVFYQDQGSMEHLENIGGRGENTGSERENISSGGDGNRSDVENRTHRESLENIDTRKEHIKDSETKNEYGSGKDRSSKEYCSRSRQDFSLSQDSTRHIPSTSQSNVTNSTRDTLKQEGTNRSPQEPRRRSESREARGSISCGESDANTPDSIVVLNSDESSPERDASMSGMEIAETERRDRERMRGELMDIVRMGPELRDRERIEREEMSKGRIAEDMRDRERTEEVRIREGDEGETVGEAKKRLRVELGGTGWRASSPISSPDSIEVLGSSSLVTSPSSIEVISGGMSSSDSSPTHQDSCSLTLIQDISPSQPSQASLYLSHTTTASLHPSEATQPFTHPSQVCHSALHQSQPSQQIPQLSQSSCSSQSTQPSIDSSQSSPHTTAPSTVPPSVVRTQPCSKTANENQETYESDINKDNAVIKQPTTHRPEDTELSETATKVTLAKTHKHEDVGSNQAGTKDELATTHKPYDSASSRTSPRGLLVSADAIKAKSTSSQDLADTLPHQSRGLLVRTDAIKVKSTSSQDSTDTLTPQSSVVSQSSVLSHPSVTSQSSGGMEESKDTLEEGRSMEEEVKIMEGNLVEIDESAEKNERETTSSKIERSLDKMEGSSGSMEENSSVIEASYRSEGSFEGVSGGGEGSSVATEGSGVALDVSVESGGSSDTITASLDSSQLTWTGSRGPDAEGSGGGVEEQAGAAVRCLLEEAMDEEEEEEEEEERVVAGGGSSGGSSSPPERERSPSSSERSEALKVGSGHTSGHSSGDDIETTTSSDIEVISSPSLDGSVAGGAGIKGAAAATATAVAASRVWASAQRGFRSFLNDRSESPASDSSSANNGKRATSERGHRRNQSNLSETSESSCEALNSSEVEKLVKRVGQLSEVLEAREAKVLELSQVNAALQDTNLRLKSHVEELEGGRGGAGEESLREEFTQRLLTMERKFQQALREKEATKKLLEEVRAEAATRPSSAEAVREREELQSVIRELREEGEKLSRQQLTYSTMLKKLRNKEKEGDSTITAQKEKLEEQSRDLERLQRQLGAKEEVERRQVEAVGQLDASRQRLEAEVRRVGQDNAELTGKMDVLKTALDAAYKEVQDLQRTAAAKDAEAAHEALSAEVGARKKLEVAMTEAAEQAERQQQALAAQVTQLQEELDQTHAQADTKESRLRSEILELQRRVAEGEGRADELAGAVTAATRPLMQQMESQRSAHTTQQASWEAHEAELIARLGEAQTALTNSIEKERAMREQYAEVTSNASSVQSQVVSLRAENTRLSGQLELITTKLQALKDSRAKETNQTASIRASLAEEAGEARRERDTLHQKLDMERTALASEKKRTAALQEQVKDRDRKLAHLLAGGGVQGPSLGAQGSSGSLNQGSSGSQGSSGTLGAATEGSRDSTPRSSPTPSLSRISISGSLSESFGGSQWGDEVFESGWARSTSLYDSVRAGGTATVDALTSSLRQREGELQHLHSEISRHETQRESLAQELVTVTTQLEEQKALAGQLEELQTQYTEMEQRYNALLQMHGEKVEEVEELRLDLADVKEMYKAQIDQLLKK